ncbi:substrate-binding domain-containing protein [Actinomadura fibrosa]|uniref:Substrate-binding domain-containing protein n=1 Tax=Actinomadura fibrosa TaxID=111802 RepID=A0ABW2XIT3_9ACTN|nr:substrate-binding domain-containing protein [Actinomadura fibrosa]
MNPPPPESNAPPPAGPSHLEDFELRVPPAAPAARPAPAAPRRRDRRSRDQLTVAAAVALSMGLVLGGGGWALAMRGTGCDGPDQWLSVSADPAIAPAVLAAADRFNAASRRAGECAAVKVVAGDSAEVAAVFRSGRGTPDVWIPDSALWPDLVGKARAGRAPSVASSPLVFAMARAAGKRHEDELRRRSWSAFEPAFGSGEAAQGTNFSLRLPDPARTGAGMASLLALQVSSGTGRAGVDKFTRMLRTAKTLPQGRSLEAVNEDEAQDEDTAVLAVPEQTVLQYNKAVRKAASRLTAVYPSQGTPYLDFPFVVATSDTEHKEVAQRFLAELRTSRAVTDMRGLGLRGVVRGGGAASSSAPGAGTEPVGYGAVRTPPRSLAVVRPGAAALIQEMWRRLGQGLNILAVIDPSAGADLPMPHRRGVSGTRLGAMRQALSTGFNLIPDDSAFGLWTLSGTTAAKPYRQLQPVRELGARTPEDGTQRLRLQKALQGVRARPGRRPGLYRTIRSAYAEVERTYRADRLNVVLVFTAGGPREGERTEYARTVNTLKEAFDPRRPVSVIVLGFGAEAASNLRRIAAVTDGGSFRIDRPETVMSLFLRSDQLRVCDDPVCPD